MISFLDLELFFPSFPTPSFSSFPEKIKSVSFLLFLLPCSLWLAWLSGALLFARVFSYLYFYFLHVTATEIRGNGIQTPSVTGVTDVVPCENGFCRNCFP